MYGFDGNDWTTGGSGIDKISGGDGRDTLLDGPLQESAKDTAKGGNGSDKLITYNSPESADLVDCGLGNDTARVDSKDVVSSNCEHVQIVDGGGGGY